MNEAETRAEFIDKQLDEAGWVTSADVRVRREYAINDGEISVSGMRRRQLIADYVLEYKNTQLAVVEAKSDEEDVAKGVAQAKLYAEKLRLSFSFAANGKHIYQINHKNGREGKIKNFPSPEVLWQMIYGDYNEWLDKFSRVPFEYGGGKHRYYQQLAVNKSVHAIAQEKQRVLLTLATGTGKTFIASQIAWKLFKSHWTLQRDGKRQPRILFLADRNILADQAFVSFSNFFNDDALLRIRPGDIAKRGRVPKNASVFFTIFQTFMSGKDGKEYFGQYDPDFFDLVIIDECHRGGANDESSWRDILNHFSPAVHLGLTATPKHKDNVNTYAYFGEPVFTYSLKEGIQDGFLTPFKVKRILTSIDAGYIYTDDDEVLAGEVEKGRVYIDEDFNKIIIIEAREQKRVEDMLANINPDEKTLVFCVDQAHALMIRDLINQTAKSTNPHYCVRVTADDGAEGDNRLRQFKNNEKTIPTILTTSHKLTTGVDAHNVRNIVLMRPIKNMIEFKQIIGRGTRLFGGKHYFTIIDFVGAHNLFYDKEWDGEAVEIENIGSGAGGNIGGDTGDDTGGDTGENTGGENPPRPPKEKIKIRLSDGKERELQSITSTYFSIGGKPISAEEFLNHLFDKIKLPDLLKSEARLRKLWANPLTRRELLKELDSAGCHKVDLLKLQELIGAEDSDLFDVLEYIAYAKPPISRKVRVETNRDNIFNLLNQAQRDFVDYVLGNYIKVGVDELAIGKLSTVLTVKYGGTHEAQKQLGTLGDIQRTFINFQKTLYQEAI